jgi:hypothetical protein
MHITTHAKKRMKQRGFKRDIIDLILEHGTPIRMDGDNATKYVLGNKGKNMLYNS